MSFRDKFWSPGTGETLEPTASATVSGVLQYPEVYRVTCDADLWLELDDGFGQMVGADGTALLLQADQVEYFKTTAQHYVLHALGVTTSGLCNYIRLED